MKKYITTAIPYVNGKPHIGHAMDYLLADIFARYNRQKGDEIRFSVGTDEHGNKNAAKAAELGVSPQAFADQGSENFKNFMARLNITYTDFIRTTDPAHEHRCQEIWQKLAPHIYKSSYEGWYCEGCEGFITEKEYEETGGVCPDHKKPYIRLSEENYYLRIADFRDQIRSKIESDEMRIIPDFRKKEFLNLLVDMPDVSISRPKKSLSWGVPVPGDETQVMYVWIDALANYITVLGFPDEDISDWWPAEVQIIGKDILRFHAGIWPAMLIGLDLPLPRTLLTHGFVTNDGEKMSKSIGNVVDPIDVMDQYGTEAFRYYFSRHVRTTEDHDFSWEKFISAYNNELANDLGNLVQRLAAMAAKYEIDLSPVQDDVLASFEQEFNGLMASYKFSDAIDFAWVKLQDLNKKIDEEKPWQLAKTDQKRLYEVMIDEISWLLSVAKWLSPFLPETSDKIKAAFSAPQALVPETPLFPRIEQAI
jgi:methionyl-tRNA synthetase